MSADAQDKKPKQVTVKTIRSSTGEYWPKIGDTVAVEYDAFDSNGKQFDSTKRRGKPLRFIVGRGQVVPGWEIAVMKMREGETARVTIPPEFGYGKKGFPGLIEPDAPFTLTLTLREIN
mmetsp:Transcript_31939/g.83406  ORF Transcript_31939/g.83406 Transcript_31939/m.83406 type:complete len:119 (-) Transcript_31939:147-503(-)